MKSLFRFSLREPSGGLPDRKETDTSKPEDTEVQMSGEAPVDRASRTTSSVATVDAAEGLIPAAELPSATDILENLFRSDEAGQPATAVNLDGPTVAARGDRSAGGPPGEGRLRELVEQEIAAGLPAVGVNPAADANLAAGSTPPAREDAPSAGTEPAPELRALSIEWAERALDEAGREQPGADASKNAEVQAASASDPAGRATSVASDWAFEETLACHKEWVESRGAAGRRADLSGFDLQHADLISVNLRHADLRDANLESADLLLADLRDSCLVRANLNECCLVGANLEGANLEGATLESAMGLVASQIAGANLREASLPEHTSEFPARLAFQRNSQTAARFFTAMMAVTAVSALMIWRTRDVQLLGNLSILPFHSAAAAAALPAAQIYLIAPVVLFILYLVFHFHLQALWDMVLQLPGIFPDGRELGQDASRIVRGLLRAHFRWMNREAASTRLIERVLALLLAYWGTPLTLFLFWARYLTLQNLHGTMLHALLFVVAFAVALYSTIKIGRPQERWSLETRHQWQWVSKLREINVFGVSVGLGAVLLFLTIGVTKGAPHGRSRAPQFGPDNIRRWAATVFWSAGYDPYADLTEAWLSRPPAHWTGADQEISSVRGATLIDTSFRYAQAYGIFLVNAHLWHTDFEGAFLSDADLRGADLGQSTLRYAILDRARLYHVNLDRSNLDGANLDRADLREANLSYCSLLGAILIDAQFQGASLYGARLSASSAERANFEKTDLRSAYLDGARLDHANLTQTYLWSAKMTGATLRGAQLGSAIFIDANLEDGDLRGAQFPGTVLSGANLSGANIDGTDLRGALGLTAAQICATKSRQGAMLAESLAGEVESACGGPLLVAPHSTPAVAPEANAPAAKNGRTGKN
ncbi:MAG TPA: pentapeptide repeat-containing protein [Candidatus Cybelea sp.]|nr:pentapeptide repeat-containing protein [Candidatus Cybelea sp.]